MAQINGRRVLIAFTLLLMCSGLAAGAPVVVYDNTVPIPPATTNQTTGSFTPDLSHGYWAFDDKYFDEPRGDEITLADTARQIVEFQLMLASQSEVIVGGLTLQLYSYSMASYDGNTGSFSSGGLLWEGTKNNVVVDGLTPVIFDVPNITVPDTFLWVASTDSYDYDAGLATFGPGTVGYSPTRASDGLDYFWDYWAEEDWWDPLTFNSDPVADFGAKVWAVPEPATISLLLLAGLFVSSKKRGLRS